MTEIEPKLDDHYFWLQRYISVPGILRIWSPAFKAFRDLITRNQDILDGLNRCL